MSMVEGSQDLEDLPQDLEEEQVGLRLTPRDLQEEEMLRHPEETPARMHPRIILPTPEPAGMM